MEFLEDGSKYYICPLNMEIRERMGHKTKDLIPKKRIKYAVLNKQTQKVSIFTFQKDVADLFDVSRKTIYRNLPYENDKYIVYLVDSVP